MSYRCLMVVAKQIATPPSGEQHKNSLERKRRPRAFNLSPLTFNLKKRFDKTIEHIISNAPPPRRHLLRVRTDCGC